MSRSASKHRPVRLGQNTTLEERNAPNDPIGLSNVWIDGLPFQECTTEVSNISVCEALADETRDHAHALENAAAQAFAAVAFTPPPPWLASQANDSATDAPQAPDQPAPAVSETQEQDRVVDSWFQSLAETVDLLVAGLAHPLAEETGIEDASSSLFDPSLSFDTLAENPSYDQTAEALNSESTSGDAGSQPPPLSRSDDDDTSALLVLASHLANRFGNGIPAVASQSFGSIGAGLPSNAVGRSENGQAAVGPSPEELALARAALKQLPLMFEINGGQTDGQVQFLARTPNYTLFLTPGAAVLQLPSAAPESQPNVSQSLTMHVVGANLSAQAVGLDQLSARTNYYIGSDPGQWRTGLANFQRVAYRDIYPGIDLIYYGKQGQIEYDFVLAPGVDPNAIRLSFNGARHTYIEQNGNLILDVGGSQIIHHAPVVYQDINGFRQYVAANFTLESNQVIFHVGEYDHSRSLVIDPAVGVATYLGDQDDEEARGIDTDGTYFYITGYTTSAQFHADQQITNPPLQSGELRGPKDAFVIKLLPPTEQHVTQVIYSTYIGGTDEEEGNALSINFNPQNPESYNAGPRVFMTGFTRSNNFPTLNPTQAAYGGNTDAFVTELDDQGRIIFSTYLGGAEEDKGNGIVADPWFLDVAYVTGYTYSAQWVSMAVPGRTKVYQGGGDAFIAKYNSSVVDKLRYYSFFGDLAEDVGTAITALDGGQVFIAGYTDSNLSIRNSFQAAGGGVQDAFVASFSGFNGVDSDLVYSSNLGGAGNDKAYGITANAAGEVLVTGWTSSPDFPTQDPYDNTEGPQDAFVTWISASTPQTTILYSTFFGGTELEEGRSITWGANGKIIFAGLTRSAIGDGFPIFNALIGNRQGQKDAFVAVLDPLAGPQGLLFSTYYGGGGAMQETEATALRVDPYLGTSVWVSGFSNSPLLPQAAPAQGYINGKDIFVVRLDDLYEGSAGNA